MHLTSGLLLALAAPAAVFAHLPYHRPYDYGYPMGPSRLESPHATGTYPYYPTGTAPHYLTGSGTNPYCPTATGSVPYHPTGTVPTGSTGGPGYPYPTAAPGRVARRADPMNGGWA